MTELAVRTKSHSRLPRSSKRPADKRGSTRPSHEPTGPVVPVSGLLDLRNDHGFLRIDGYLPDPGDVFVSPAHIRKYGLRRGDAITGAAKAATGDNQRSSLASVDTVNGMPAALLGDRPNFYDMTPLYPKDRIRLETTPKNLTTRVIDLLTPIGKGQRVLIVSPPKAGKTMVIQAIANAISTNYPDTHLMALLIDERPEEVTDMQRTIRGEVIASTFDRPPSDHITAAELAIERAKRLVEQGRDVVVLLDSITRLARAHNLAAPTGGRTMSGGIDSTALYAPKRFLGAARNIENGGSLTIIATALVDTGSAGDNIIFEEFKSTGNAELRLLRAMADRRIFPAADIHSSGTRREELLLDPNELALTRMLRKALQNNDSNQGIEMLIDRLKNTGSNAEFLRSLSPARRV